MWIVDCFISWSGRASFSAMLSTLLGTIITENRRQQSCPQCYFGLDHTFNTRITGILFYYHLTRGRSVTRISELKSVIIL